MKNFDYLFVCGVEATILAYISKVPYIIWPHGGDIRFASGLHSIIHRIKNCITYFLIRKSKQGTIVLMFIKKKYSFMELHQIMMKEKKLLMRQNKF